ncbi:unnamed protein product [Protopolystoma xenopodis]|uniref:Prefoldin subunit 3 n=1 Tax=Protopolystoma xenopodis TaxID=117903 RepID=A0A448X6X1_9PLAT|nr:unnamed protein product [Protopolystoma xenopodis]
MSSLADSESTSCDTTADLEKKGIPKATFIEDVDKFLKDNNFSSLQEAGHSFEQMYMRYKHIEQAFFQRKLRLLQQIPNIRKTLDVVRHLKQKSEDLDVNFEVSSQLYAKAHIKKADKVGLWLGANVMLEYTLDEAEKILIENDNSAQVSMVDVDNALDFLKDQCTTVEVNLARLHNLSIKISRQTQGAAASLA